MQNEAYLDEHAANSEIKSDGSTGSGNIDPVLSNVKSAIELNAGPSTKEHMKLAEPKELAQKFEGQAQAIRQVSRKTLLARWLFERVNSFRKRPDSPRILSVLLLLTVFAWRPGFVIFLAVMASLIGLVLYFSVGPDRAQTWAYERYRRLRKRNPEGAERIRQRAAESSKKLSEIIDKLPESWTKGLYLPDFEEPEEIPEKFKADPFERLANQLN